MPVIRNPYRGRLILTTEEGTVRLDRTAPEAHVGEDSEPEVAAAAASQPEEGPRFVTGEAVRAEPETIEETVQETEETEEDEEEVGGDDRAADLGE